MNAIITAIDRRIHSLRQATDRLVARLTRRATLKVAVTVSLPPFVKVTIHYEASLAKPANDNKRRRIPEHSA